MRNNETGEFELVVGNRQLLSGFFIVVLLLAVAFAMGYVVGQNSPHSAKARRKPQRAGGRRPITGRMPRHRSSAEPAAQPAIGRVRARETADPVAAAGHQGCRPRSAAAADHPAVPAT